MSARWVWRSVGRLPLFHDDAEPVEGAAQRDGRVAVANTHARGQLRSAPPAERE